MESVSLEAIAKLMSLGNQLMNPLVLLVEPQRRVYWLCILVALAFMLLYFRGDFLNQLKKLFDLKAWLSPSSRADLKMIALNGLLKAIIFPSTKVLSLGFAAILSLSLKSFFSPPELSISLTWIVACYSIALFVVDDFSRYFWHRIQHRYEFLWHFHKVHHSAEVLTPFTLFRSHPVDILGGRLRFILAHGSVTSIFFFLFGNEITVWEILGTEAIGFIFNSAAANLRHSPVWMHFGPFEKLFISPAAHQIHHSSDPKDFDSNFGAFFSVWDQIGGSHRPANQQEPVTGFGLGEAAHTNLKTGQSIHSLKALYVVPFMDALGKNIEETSRPIEPIPTKTHMASS